MRTHDSCGNSRDPAPWTRRARPETFAVAVRGDGGGDAALRSPIASAADTQPPVRGAAPLYVSDYADNDVLRVPPGGGESATVAAAEPADAARGGPAHPGRAGRTAAGARRLPTALRGGRSTES
ncbi:hypothetical protein [Streptomyces sp. CA-146814]|uniref:hypothetical protein n=1 Tax=Streptomyces sp. CA-146814 TaxID=3240053 RepID=UPI003D903AA0